MDTTITLLPNGKSWYNPSYWENFNSLHFLDTNNGLLPTVLNDQTNEKDIITFPNAAGEELFFLTGFFFFLFHEVDVIIINEDDIIKQIKEGRRFY